MSETTTASQNTSPIGSGSTKPFKEAVVHEPQEVSREAHQPPGEVTIATSPNPADPSLDAFKEEHGAYANKYFDLDTPFDYLPSDMQDKLQTIDRFVENEIASKHLKSTISTYNKIMDEIKMQVVSNDELKHSEQIDLLAAYADNMLKLDDIDDLKEELRHKLRYARRPRDMNNMVLKVIGKRIL